VYHLSRLLLLYHDPQLCNHIDSLKLSFSDFRYNKPGHESVLWIRVVGSDSGAFGFDGSGSGPGIIIPDLDLDPEPK
jgi:hypothetical protein